MRAVDLFAGAGGWDQAARRLGVEVVGIENNPWVCATRREAGHATVEGSVMDYGPEDFDLGGGLIASPPCRTFSMLGKRTGTTSMPAVLAGVRDLHRYGSRGKTFGLDPLSLLVLEPLRWVLEAFELDRPYRWIALEQVPAVLPVWKLTASALRKRGYSTAVGKINAEQYGVPTTRQRAVLLASLDHDVHLPAPRFSAWHPRTPAKLDQGVLAWRTIQDVLPEREGWCLVSPNAYKRKGLVRRWDQPCWTLAFGNGWWRYFNWVTPAQGARRERTKNILSLEEAAAITTFPRDYPWQHQKHGWKYRQIGDAVPPRLALALLREVARSGRTAR